MNSRRVASRLPKTLKLRAILIFCAVFVLAQTLSLIIFERNRDEVVLFTEAADLSDRIIGIVNLAYSFPEQDRQLILAAAETQFLAMFPDIVAVEDTACLENSFSEQMSARIHGAFAALHGVDAQICVRSINAKPLLSRQRPLQGFDVMIAVNFPDRSQTVFHAILPEAKSLLQDWVLVYLLLVAVVALLLAWYLIRKAVAPIEQLAHAADEIGINIDSPPLDESGPLEVSRAAKAFNRMQARLARLLHSQTEMLAAISHDLRSAVTRLQLRAELLQNDHEREGMLQVVGDMRRMTQSVLDFVRGHNPDEPLRKVNITALVESLCEDLREEGVAVTCAEDAPAVNLFCRITDVRRSLQNIIDNAIKYAGSAEVSVTRDNHDGLITVADRGAGIPEDQLDAVLQPFYRIEQSRNRQTGGIGLGLAISQNIVQAHGGQFRLANRPGGGLIVEMRFPLSSPLE